MDCILPPSRRAARDLIMRHRTLERILELILIVLLIAAGAAGAVVSMLDFLGVDYVEGPWRWLKGPQPIALMIVGLLALSLGLERLLFFKRVEEKLAEIEERISGEMDVNQMRKLFDKNLDKVFGKRLLPLLEQIEKARREKTITLSGKDDIEYWFPRFFSETLKAFPNSRFVATSLPYPEYFWKHEHILEEIKSFTRHGSMERIFFLTRESDINKEAVRNILKQQHESGVKVYATDVSKFPEHLKAKANEFMMVAWDEDIGWHAEARNRRMRKVKATADRDTVSRYRQVFEEIKNLRSTWPYSPPPDGAEG